MAIRQLSDKGLSIFTFAAYHQLASGESVSEVVLRDGAGHAADPRGVEEVQALGLVTVEADRGVLTPAGAQLLGHVVEQIRGTAKLAQQTTALA